MAEIIHEHSHTDGGNSMGFIMGIVLLIVALFVIVYYLVPSLRGGSTTFNFQVPPSVNVHLR